MESKAQLRHKSPSSPINLCLVL